MTVRTTWMSVAGIAIETCICCMLLRDALQDVAMVYLLGVTLAAVLLGRAASILTAVLSVGALDFFFTRPYFTFEVEDRRLLLTFGVFLLVAYVIGVLADRVRQVTLVAQRHELAAQNERMRSALLSSLSHDLKTPLSVVIGAASALLDGENHLPADHRRQYLVTIADETSRVSRLVRHLFYATSVESGVVRVRKEWVPLEEIVGVALARLGPSLDERAVDVRIERDASIVSVDATLLEQVFLNLLENAARHTPARSPIAISARRIRDTVEVAVTDSGGGVPRGLEEKLFESFQRGERSGGMGLGLAICRGIVAAHGGRIWCENRVGAGSSFRFVLPCGESPPFADE